MITKYLLKKQTLNISLMTMMRRRRLLATFTFSILIFTFAHATLHLGVCDDGGKIDLFTDKVPFDGRGLNKWSDAFQPQELVNLYAEVTYNDEPILNWPVAFQVLNPLHETITSHTSLTDDDGIATFSFRIPWPSEGAEQTIFGDWKTVATVSIAGKTFNDTLIFRVGWIVQITDIKTLNATLNPQTSFFKGETIVFNLSVKNIALTNKSAVIIVNALDAADYPIIHEICTGKPVVFQPGENIIQVVTKIPENATVGRATVFAVAYTALPEYGGVPYSPPCSSFFNVLMPPRIRYYLTVKTEPLGVVSIPGEGWYDEGTNVSLTALEIVPVSWGMRYKFKYWDVDGTALAGNPITLVIDGNHTATAHYSVQYLLEVISPYGVVGGGGWYEANETAYAFLNVDVVDHGNGTRRVFASWSGDAYGTNYTKSEPILMNKPKIAVANWKTQHLLSVATEPAGLSPQPSRNPFGDPGSAGGWWYDAYTNVSLSAPPVKGYDFNHWDVDGVPQQAGVYQLAVYMDGPHRATAHYSEHVAGWFTLEWFYWILPLLLALIIVLLCILIYRRRKKAKAGESAFQRGWAAWYYGHNLRGKIRRV